VLEEPSLHVADEVRRDAALHPGLTDDLLARDPESARLFATLPPIHQRLLRTTDGLETLGASYRLLGFDRPSVTALAAWNREETWKFAWGAMAEPYLCFGQSVLGNQYAYRWDALGKGDATPVAELYAVTLEPVVEHDSFADFLRGEVAQVPDDPYHERIRRARERFGDFDPDQLLVYVPSPLLAGGRVDRSELLPMEAATAMIVNGDLASQLAHRTDLDGLERLETYRDERGRERVRVVWAAGAGES
jgi:hypothetical protein